MFSQQAKTRLSAAQVTLSPSSPLTRRATNASLKRNILGPDVALTSLYLFSVKVLVITSPPKKVTGPVEEHNSTVGGSSLPISAAPAPPEPVGATVVGHAAPSLSRVAGPRKKVPTKGSARGTTLKTPFTGEYCTFLSRHWPLKGLIISEGSVGPLPFSPGDGAL